MDPVFPADCPACFKMYNTTRRHRKNYPEPERYQSCPAKSQCRSGLYLGSTVIDLGNLGLVQRPHSVDQLGTLGCHWGSMVDQHTKGAKSGWAGIPSCYF